MAIGEWRVDIVRKENRERIVEGAKERLREESGERRMA